MEALVIRQTQPEAYAPYLCVSYNPFFTAESLSDMVDTSELVNSEIGSDGELSSSSPPLSNSGELFVTVGTNGDKPVIFRVIDLLRGRTVRFRWRIIFCIVCPPLLPLKYLPPI